MHRPVIAVPHDQRVLGDTEIFKVLKYQPHVTVVLGQLDRQVVSAVYVLRESEFLWTCADRVGCVRRKVDKERFVALSVVRHVLVDGFGAPVVDFLIGLTVSRHHLFCFFPRPSFPDERRFQAETFKVVFRYVQPQRRFAGCTTVLSGELSGVLPPPDRAVVG